MKSSTKAVAEFGVMLAVLFVAMTLDRAFSAWNLVSFAIVSVAATASFAMLKNRPLLAIASGSFFGLASLVTAFMFGKTAFFNPLVSVLPRMFIGITGYGAYKLAELLLCRVKNKRISEYIALTAGAAFVALSNTVYTLTCLWLFAQGDPLFVAFNVVFLTNALPEMVVAALATPPIVLGVRRGLRLGIDGKPRKKERDGYGGAAEKAAEIKKDGNV